MASHTPHSGDSRPGPSWESGSNASSSADRRHPPLKPQKSAHHPPELTAGGYFLRLYKVVYDNNIPHPTVQSRDFVRRYNGKCGEKYKQLDFAHPPSDPRSRYRRLDAPKNLIVPKFIVDDQFTGIPPKREVTISNLNDNVNKDFLTKMAKNQKLEPEEVHVFYHPMTKKHLGIALILFPTSKDAAQFIETSDGSPVMGNPITCRLDPFAAELNAMFASATGVTLPTLNYLSAMSEHELSLRREKLIRSMAPSPPAAEQLKEDERNRSLSPMDTSNSPAFEPVPPPPSQPHHHHHQSRQDRNGAARYDDAGASGSMRAMPSPPPPYSELPPRDHASMPHEQQRRSSEHRTHSAEHDGRPRRDKRRHASTSSSSSESSAHSSTGSHRRSDGGVKRKKREEYLKVKRYVSSERDSNGDKRIVKEVKTVTYKRRTEQRTTMKDVSPDSFDEEMKRRERSLSKGEMREGKDGEMCWSSPSSDSDAGNSRRKRAKERTESHSRDEERRPMPQTPSSSSYHASPACPPHSSSSSSYAPTPSSRRKGFHSAPVFDPTQPPPMIVPPVGLVVPDCSVPPPPPPPPLQFTMPPPMFAPPPPLPGGFIPPPEFFGLQSTPEMLNAAAAAAAAGMPPMSLPPPPMGCFTPMQPAFGSPVRPHKMHPVHKPEDVMAASAAVAPPLLTRASSSASLAAAGRTPADKGTPTTPSEGGNTPGAVTASAEKKANLDDRLSQIFGIKKARKEEGEEEEIKHASSAAPSFSAQPSGKQRQEDDMDIDDDDDMDMDVASASSGEARRGADNRPNALQPVETEEEKKSKEEAERRIKEKQVTILTNGIVDRFVKDMEQQIARDLQRRMETTAFQVLESWEKRQKSEEEERKKQVIREAAQAAAAARDGKDPMEEMLAAKLLSPEGLKGGISKVFSSISIIKKKVIPLSDFSRDGTPASRDSRAPSRARSRSSTRSRSTSSSSESDERRRKRRRGRDDSVESSSDSEEENEEEEDTVRRRNVRRRPNMRNIESSQESSAASTSGSSDSEDESSEKENTTKRSSDEDVDVLGMSEDEADEIKMELESATASPAATASTSAAAAAAAEAAAAADEEQVLKKEEEEEEEGAKPPPPPSTARQPTPPLSSSAPSAAAAARLAAQRRDALDAHHQPTMRVAAGAYDPIRCDHPYVRQLGIPFDTSRTIVAKGWRAAGAAGAPAAPAAAAAARTGVVAAAGKAPTLPTAAAAAAIPAPAAAAAAAVKPIKSKTDAQKRIAPQDKVPNELLNLLSAPVARTKPERRPRKTFKKRTVEEEDRIRDSFKAGMDQEDEDLMKKVLADLQKDGARPFGTDREIHFESRIRAFTPLELVKPAKLGKLDLFYDDNELAGVIPHSTGCARAQGIYRLTFKQKIRIMRRPEAYQDRTEINERDEIVKRHQVQASKEQRSMNRRLQTMVDSNPNSDFFKVNQLKYRKKMIKFARSCIHGWGLYALEPIAPDDMIVEYIGQKIRPIVADEREKAYERRGIGSSYLFRIDEDEVIDATRQGNFARFINHSCQPNCYAKVVTVDGDKRIVIYSKSLIQKGDEITYDYKFPIEEDKIECLCGAPQCRGTLN